MSFSNECICFSCYKLQYTKIDVGSLPRTALHWQLITAVRSSTYLVQGGCFATVGDEGKRLGEG